MKLSWLSKLALIALISTTISAQEAQINCTTPAQTEKEEQTPAEKQAPKLSEKDAGAVLGGLFLLILMAAILDADKTQKQEAEDAAKNVQEKEKQEVQEIVNTIA